MTYGSARFVYVTAPFARMIEVLAPAFGAQEIARVVVEDCSIGYVEVRFEDSVVMVFDARAHGARE